MTPPSWLPIALSAVGTSIALLAFAWQIHRARFNQSIDLLFRLENDFFGPVKRVQRAKACRDLQLGNTLEAEPILDFFETMALLLRRGALDEEMVWHTFFYWIENYYQALLPAILERQKTEPLVWRDFLTLVKKVEGLQARQLRIGTLPKPTSEQVAAFLAEEQTEAEL
jgi:hypothetical protein